MGHLSPYNHSSSTIGQWMPNHTSNFNLGYDSASLPTPWPYLLLSYSISIGLAIYGFISYYKDYRKAKNGEVIHERPSRWDYTWEAGKLIILTTRSVSVFVEALRGNPRNRNSHRRLAPSAVFVLLISMIPYTMAYKGLYWIPHLRLVVFIELFLVYIALCISMSSHLGSGMVQYGALFSTGTICPIPVQSCSNVGAIVSSFICDEYSARTNISFYKVNSKNHLAKSELMWPWFGFIFGGFVIMATFPSIDAAQITVLNDNSNPAPYSGNTAFVLGIISLFRRPQFFRLSAKAHTINTIIALVSLVSIIIVIVTALPIHICAQTTSQTFTIVDGQQLLSNFPDSYPSGWIDCYQFRTPTDRLGFWSFWISKEHGNIASRLGVI